MSTSIASLRYRLTLSLFARCPDLLLFPVSRPPLVLDSQHSEASTPIAWPSTVSIVRLSIATESCFIEACTYQSTTRRTSVFSSLSLSLLIRCPEHGVKLDLLLL